MTGTPLPTILTVGLRKSFGETTVLDGVDISVAKGSVFALLGPNGAGKTTMVRILSTLIPADSGEVRVAGHDVQSDPDGVRATIGVTGQFSAVDDLLTGEENLQLMADLNHLGRVAGRHRVAELLDRFDLIDAAHRPVSSYSGGMRRRLDLAMTLVGSPQVIFLDEPTTGLDPRAVAPCGTASGTWPLAGSRSFLTTQYLDEADHLADRIAVLDHGRIVAEGSAEELKRRIPGGHVRLHFCAPDALRKAASLLDVPAPDEDKLALQVPERRPGRLAAPAAQPARRGPDRSRAAVHPYPGPRRRVLCRHRARRPRERSVVMTTVAYTVIDSSTLLRRNLRRLLRYPSMTLLLVGMPIVLLVLFVYVFGGQLSHGLTGGLSAHHAGRAGYLNYVTPGILLVTVGAAVQGTAIVVAMDMTGGIIDRFRTMAIARGAVLTGHVLASLIQTMVSIAIVVGVALALGFRPDAGLGGWLGAIGVLTLFILALIWLATALGLAAKSVETASNTPMILTLLPFLGSGFVPTATMPEGLRQFAEYQPFTPVTETLRGLLTGTPIGTNAVAAVAWSAGIALVSYFWAMHLYRHRKPA